MIDANGDLMKYGEDGDIYYAEWISEKEFLEYTSSLNQFSGINAASTRKVIGYVVPTDRKPSGVSPSSSPSINDMRPLKAPIPKYLLEHVGKILEERDRYFRERRNNRRNQGVKMHAISESSEATIDRNLLVIYVRFEDESNMPELQKREISNEEINNLIFNNTRQGSVAHYYKTVTDGRVRFIPAKETHGTRDDGIIRVTVPGSHKNWSLNDNRFISDVIMSALSRAAQYIDFRNFTNLANLYGEDLSIVFLVHGYEMSFSNGSGIWAHAG